jgi:hypothetical protein
MGCVSARPDPVDSTPCGFDPVDSDPVDSRPDPVDSVDSAWILCSDPVWILCSDPVDSDPVDSRGFNQITRRNKSADKQVLLS